MSIQRLFRFSAVKIVPAIQVNLGKPWRTEE